jgi:hypothetical protein
MLLRLAFIAAALTAILFAQARNGTSAPSPMNKPRLG